MPHGVNEQDDQEDQPNNMRGERHIAPKTSAYRRSVQELAIRERPQLAQVADEPFARLGSLALERVGFPIGTDEEELGARHRCRRTHLDPLNAAVGYLDDLTNRL